MSPTAAVLMALVTWSLILTVVIVSHRGLVMLGSRHPVNTFRPDAADLSPFAQRLVRAHANCFENLPGFAALLLYAIATEQTAITDPWAPWLLAARIGQSTTHVISTSALAVWIRVTFFSVQIAIVAVFIVTFVT